jgi:hypothetical protein
MPHTKLSKLLAVGIALLSGSAASAPLHIEVTATGFNSENYMGAQLDTVVTTALPATVNGTFDGLALTVRAPAGNQFVVDVEDGLTTNASMYFNYLANAYGPPVTNPAIALTFEGLTGVAPPTFDNGSQFYTSGARFTLDGRFTATQDFAFSAVTISTAETYTTAGALNELSNPLVFITGDGTRAAVSLQAVPAPLPGTLILFSAGGLGLMATRHARRRRRWEMRRIPPEKC